MERMSAVEIIKDTVHYYCDHKRGLDKHTGECVYYDPSIKARCAIGRFSASEELDVFEGAINEFVDEMDSLDNYLDPKVHGQSLRFWYDLQSFHDSDFLWVRSTPGESGKALTDRGEREYKRLLEKYGSKTGS